MITVYGEGRGFRVVWLLEEMGLSYTLRDVDMLAGVENDPEFLGVNPGGFIPAIDDEGTIMVESIAILQYLLARYGPSPLAPGPNDPDFARYLQFLHLGEAGLATPMMVPVVSSFLAPEDERDNWGSRWSMGAFERRMRLVRRQLEQAPYMAGERFTAADISVTYALEFAKRAGGYTLQEPELRYIARTTAREGYARAMDGCPATKAWVESMD